MWCPTSDASSRIGEIKEGEGGELGDESVLDRQKEGWPCDSWGNDAICVPSVPLHAAVFSPFQSPMDGAQEGYDLDIG